MYVNTVGLVFSISILLFIGFMFHKCYLISKLVLYVLFYEGTVEITYQRGLIGYMVSGYLLVEVLGRLKELMNVFR